MKPEHKSTTTHSNISSMDSKLTKSFKVTALDKNNTSRDMNKKPMVGNTTDDLVVRT